MCRLGVSRYRNAASSPVSCSIVVCPRSSVVPVPPDAPRPARALGVRHLRTMRRGWCHGVGVGVPGGEPAGGGLVLNAFRLPAIRSAGAELLRRLVHGGDAPLAHRLAGGRHRRLRPRRGLRLLARLGGAGRERRRRGRDSAVLARVAAGAGAVLHRAEEELAFAVHRRRGAPRGRARHHVALPAPALPAAPAGPIGDGGPQHRLRRRRHPRPPPRHHPPAHRPADGRARARLHPRRRLGHRRQARTGLPPAARARPPGLGDRDHQLPAEPARPPGPTTSWTASGPWPGCATTSPSTAGTPAFIAVSGGSAGGHLGALLALTPGDPAFQPGFEEADTSVDACVPFYGVYDMTAGRGTAGTTRAS